MAVDATLQPVQIGDPLPEGWLRATVTNYKLDRFLTAKIEGDPIDGRRDTYFRYLEISYRMVSDFQHRRGISGSIDTAVRDYVAKVLAEDDSFTAFVLQNRGPSTELGNEDKWKPIWTAAAGSVMQAYKAAVANGEWPHG